MTLFAEEYKGLTVMKHSIQAVGWTLSEQAVAHPNSCSVHALFSPDFLKGLSHEIALWLFRRNRDFEDHSS